MKNKIREILSDLERTRENLLSLSDDIWLSIDHNNPDALEEGVAFKKEYNDKLIAFDRVAEALSALVQQYTQVRIEEETEDRESLETTETRDRIIRELDREEPHRLDEDFRYKRPYGFILEGCPYKDVVTWRRIYDLVCRQLLQKGQEKMLALPDHPEFATKRGNHSFSRSREGLRSAGRITEGLFAEINLSANSLRDQIRKLLGVFGIPESDMTIYLRRDLDAPSDKGESTSIV